MPGQNLAVYLFVLSVRRSEIWIIRRINLRYTVRM